MMSNTPTLMQSEEERAPWVRCIDVDISVTLSKTCVIDVPIDFDESDTKALEEAVKDQVLLPQDLIEIGDLPNDWIIDDFCVL